MKDLDQKIGQLLLDVLKEGARVEEPPMFEPERLRSYLVRRDSFLIARAEAIKSLIKEVVEEVIGEDGNQLGLPHNKKINNQNLLRSSQRERLKEILK